MRILLLIFLIWVNPVFADLDIDTINKILNRSELSKGNYSLYIKNISKRKKIFSYNEQKAFNPASVMKLVSTYAGLQLLGPQYQWKTEVLYKGNIKNKHLYGDLIIKGLYINFFIYYRKIKIDCIFINYKRFWIYVICTIFFIVNKVLIF
ncbi:MAG: D-alanyl-D-alanine carboxypeptidase [Candidatus Methylopumilus sp.]